MSGAFVYAADTLGCVLLALNITGLFVSVAAIALYAAADAAGALLSAPPLFITLLITTSCALGIPASCKRAVIGPSCWLLLCVSLHLVYSVPHTWSCYRADDADTPLSSAPPLSLWHGSRCT